MLQSAVNKCKPAASSQKSPGAYRQQSIGGTFKQPATTQSSATRPLSNGSGNVIRHTPADKRPQEQTHGTKRTSSGLAKQLSSQQDAFEYPTLNTSEIENNAPRNTFQNSISNHISKPPVYFDEDDFDSDLDLDVEDPATKSTISYPTLPPEPSTHSNIATQGSGVTGHARSPPPDSSQPISWPSSPIEHFQPPPKAQKSPLRSQEPKATKRSTLPWLEKENIKARRTAVPDSEEELEDDHQELAPHSKKRRSTTSTQSTYSTPRSSNKSQYSWDVSLSTHKQQQKNLREANKKAVKANEATDEDVKKAIEKKKMNTVHRIFLSEEQQHVLNLVVEYKKSVFFTGSAGTGKSVLLREIISALRRKFIREPDRVAVTASTGLAACNIGGVTLHSFAGIGLGKEPAEDLIKKIRRNQKAKMRWMRTKILIVDEVSMVDGDLFDKLETIARTIRNNGRPFGGIQLIITGDFFQLPPVPDSGRQSKFCFDAGTWTTSIDHTIGLNHVFRQKDPVFANMLNEMREGRLTQQSIAQFAKLDRPLEASNDNIEATELFPTRSEVDRANTLRMNQLHGQSFPFHARDGGTVTDKAMRDRLLQNCMVPETVFLKKGAQVMLVKNMDDTLVNGSLGKVMNFMTEQMFQVYKENENAFYEGRADSAHSDTPSDDAVQKALGKQALGLSTQILYPIVRFTMPDGTTRDLLCKRESWKVEQPNGEVLASRDQIPLILAWALSIHKAQGQTLERVRVDLGRVFEKGQAYVALSRATSMQGLQVLRFDPRKVLAHEKVRSFYRGLARAEGVSEDVKSKTVMGKLGMGVTRK